jgi:hypothetical protein
MTVWERRDYPVLHALANSDDENLRHGFLSAAEQLGLEMTPGDLHDALLALADADYIDVQVGYESGPSALFTHLQVTGRGQQALGQWPLFDEIASPETLAMLLEHLAAEAATSEEESNLRRAADYVRGVSAATLRALVIGVVAQLAKSGLGLG